jgi:hypothetical protein
MQGLGAERALLGTRATLILFHQGQASHTILSMSIEIRNVALEEKLRKQMAITGAESVEEVLVQLLHTQEEQDRWLALNREMIDAKIKRGIEQLERGEGIPDDKLDEYLARLKNEPE